ncbi:glycoside hydrolase family 78 protein [Mollisia scopiformis]|uniref:Glycoside hydrolase family 78 protein n=1 Tax=Mollisia scopiformis TaxID=149040 RepID=A0A194X845_MOLSC|nr:glycoside hydrolase family 78 protein [Mollisia scopiformis]KUJ15977.1 glycoside hydrolase family 78 protein [Mollisia scopiformis]
MTALVVQSSASCWRDTICVSRTASFPGPWEKYIYAPDSRLVSPAKILNPDHSLISMYPETVNLSSNESLVIYDFGKEVGGIATLSYQSRGSGQLGLSFSEARNWTGYVSDDSNGKYQTGADGALFVPVTNTSRGNFTMSDSSLRGGFRYLSLFTTSNSTFEVNITAISLELSFQPTWSDLRAYGGYFSSNDDLLNRIWYAGAYTLQTNAISPNTGRAYPLLDNGWANNASLGTSGASIFTDGAKRDRATWSGDLGIALPSAFVSTGDFESAKNALQLQFDLQKFNGELPMAGPPLSFYGSDTYHMSSIIGTYEYIVYSGDTEFLTRNWRKIKLAIQFVTAKIDSTGILFAQGGHNTQANALMYKTLTAGSALANWTGDNNLARRWKSQAAVLKNKINAPDSYRYPQDGNSLALYYDMANSSSYKNISDYLFSNWGLIGASCPEMEFNIVPFIESMEIKGHFAAHQTTRALDLIRRSWGWYLNNPYGTESTFIEGYLEDGTFGYRANAGYQNTYSYVSHSHGWSTGPTHALSTFVVGLQLTSPGGKTWIIAPQFGDLKSVEGGFTTNLGKFSVKWILVDDGFVLEYNVPSTTSGKLILPASVGKTPKVRVNGGLSTQTTYDVSSGVVTIEKQPGGESRIQVWT